MNMHSRTRKGPRPGPETVRNPPERGLKNPRKGAEKLWILRKGKNICMKKQIFLPFCFKTKKNRIRSLRGKTAENVAKPAFAKK